MMIAQRRYGWFLAVVWLVGMAAQPRAQTSMKGDIGLDLENLRFTNQIKDTTRADRDFAVRRSLSSHFLDLQVAGPLISGNFADYTARARLFGTYYRVNGDAGKRTLYIKPSVPTYSSSLSLFSQRTYPLRVYYSKARDYSVRYESNNRSKVDLISPELAVVRRYQSDNKTWGGVSNVSFSQNAMLSTEIKHEEAQIGRNYDFGEDKDIWATFTTTRPRLLEPEHEITVQNGILDDTVRVFIDLDSVVTLLPRESFTFPLDSGRFEVEFVPQHLNSYRTLVNVHGDMIWKILFSLPSSPNDVDRNTNGVTSMLNIGGDGPFKSQTRYEYSDAREAVQGVTTFLSSFSNSAGYDFSRLSKIDFLTTYEDNDMTVDTISSQLNRTFMHQTTARWGRHRGISANLSHSITKASTVTDVEDFSSTTHTIGNQWLYPMERMSYKIALRNDAILLTESRGYANRQYKTELTNSFVTRRFGVTWEPKHEIKYIYTTQDNPDQVSKELESRLMLGANVANLPVLGKLRLRGEYTWREREAAGDTDLRKRYFVEAMITRRFTRKYRLLLMASQEKETFGGSISTSTIGTDEVNPARQDQLKSNYKIDIQLEPVPGFSFGANAIVISQGTTNVSRLGATLSAKIPKLEIPIRSFITSETRTLEGLDKQTQLQAETKLSYRFRQISLVLTHRLIRENLLAESYRFQEILGNISRRFSVF